MVFDQDWREGSVRVPDCPKRWSRVQRCQGLWQHSAVPSVCQLETAVLNWQVQNRLGAGNFGGPRFYLSTIICSREINYSMTFWSFSDTSISIFASHDTTLAVTHFSLKMCWKEATRENNCIIGAFNFYYFYILILASGFLLLLFMLILALHPFSSIASIKM